MRSRGLERVYIMKIKSAYSSFLLLGLIGSLLLACTMPGNSPVIVPTALANPQVEAIFMQRPLNGAVYTLDTVVQLDTAVRGTSMGNISGIDFLANGTSVAAGTGSSDAIVSYFGASWTPSQAGLYYVQSKAVMSDGSIAISQPVRVCVIPVSSPLFNSERGGYLGPCAIPTRIPDATSSGDITINVLTSPQTVSKFTDTACPNSSVDFTFVAQVDDPQDQVAFLGLDFDWIGSGYFRFFLNWVTTRPLNRKEYRASIPLSPFQVAETSDQGARWRITAYGRDGQELQSAEGTIPTEILECSQQPLQAAPTSTPASDRDCPPGTYYASNRCIQIQINPPSDSESPNSQPGCPAGETYTCDPVCGCAPG